MDVWEDLTAPQWTRVQPTEFARKVEWLLEHDGQRSRTCRGLPLSIIEIGALTRARGAQIGVVRLPHILDALDYLGIRPRDLTDIRVPDNFLPHRYWGPEEFRAELIAAIIRGRTKASVLEGLNIAASTLDDCLDVYVEDGSITREEAIPYRNAPPQLSPQRLDGLAMMVRLGFDDTAIQKRTGLGARDVRAVRKLISSSETLELGAEQPVLPANLRIRWTREHLAKRERVNAFLDAAIQAGRPVTLADLSWELVGNIYNGIRKDIGSFGGPGGEEFKSEVCRKIVESWVRAYPDREELVRRLRAGHHRIILEWFQDLGYR